MEVENSVGIVGLVGRSKIGANVLPLAAGWEFIAGRARYKCKIEI